MWRSTHWATIKVPAGLHASLEVLGLALFPCSLQLLLGVSLTPSFTSSSTTFKGSNVTSLILLQYSHLLALLLPSWTFQDPCDYTEPTKMMTPPGSSPNFTVRWWATPVSSATLISLCHVTEHICMFHRLGCEHIGGDHYSAYVITGLTSNNTGLTYTEYSYSQYLPATQQWIQNKTKQNHLPLSH